MIEEILITLSDLSAEDLEKLIQSYRSEIDYSLPEIADSMEDSSRLSSLDDQTMAKVKMLSNWQAVQEACGEFIRVAS